jgi:pimeloyl-ACP methyl ester carboxylesterase
MAAASHDFEFQGHRLVYDEYGEGPHVIVLLPGLLFSRRIHEPLAEELASRGSRVLCLDLLGHGDSDRPPEMPNYSMTAFGRQVIALLDHAGVERAVIGGTSLGANTALEASAAAPQVHPFSDSDMLVRELPNARLVEASSILELRLTPERLTAEIAGFVEECFRARARGAGRSRPARSRSRGESQRGRSS